MKDNFDLSRLPRHDFVIIGFPKCGTSSLCRTIESSPKVNVARNNGGTLECDITRPTFRPNESFFSAGHINGHKFTAYAFSKRKLTAVSAWSPDAEFVICVRDPIRVLLSWFKMYRKVAERGRPSSHKAVRERDFFLSCNVAEFYEHFASSKLRHGDSVATALKVLPPGSVSVISQEFQAKDPVGTSRFLEQLLGAPIPLPEEPKIHTGLADTLNPEELVPKSILEELAALRTQMDLALRAVPDERKIV